MQDQLGGDEDQGEDGERRAEDGQAGAPMIRPMSAEMPGSPGRGGADLPGDDVLGPPLPDADRGEARSEAGNTPARAPPRTTKARTVTAVPGCHQMSAAASYGQDAAPATTGCGGTGRGSTARPIRTAVSAPQ